jgi:hypothetical protein
MSGSGMRAGFFHASTSAQPWLGVMSSQRGMSVRGRTRGILRDKTGSCCGAQTDLHLSPEPLCILCDALPQLTEHKKSS